MNQLIFSKQQYYGGLTYDTANQYFILGLEICNAGNEVSAIEQFCDAYISLMWIAARGEIKIEHNNLRSHLEKLIKILWGNISNMEENEKDMQRHTIERIERHSAIKIVNDKSYICQK